ncbi:MAG: insulinase family protein [Gemmataceae bacterium]|nr:insulinase family protein [Gemmataceae bacterium]
MFQKHTLPNGLTIIGEILPQTRSVAIGFFVRTGSRDESPEEAGLSHYLEHMVFKGTPRRTALDVNKDFDRIGANYNAYTSEENTVFYAAVLPEYLPQATDILADILRPSLRDEDFDMEKNVILEEIGMYDDQPGWATFDNAKRHYFGEHPLGPAVLGTQESIRAMTRDRMHSYFRRRYVAPNITVVAAGNYDWNNLIALVTKACGQWESGPVGRQNIRPAKGPGTHKTVTKATVTQEHVVLLAPAPAADDPLRHAADLLATALGDDSGSRLYWELVDPGYAESADTSYHEYEGTGIFYTSYSGEPGQTAENLARVQRVFAEVQKDGLSAEELQQAKSKVLSRVVRGSERPMGRLQALGMAWTYLGKYRSVDDELSAFEAVDLSTIRQVLDRYPLTNATSLAFGPLETV